MLISKAQVRRYWRDGFVFVPGLFAPSEVGAWGVECDRLWQKVDLSSPRIQSRKAVGEGTVEDRIDPVLDISPMFRELAHDDRVIVAVRAVLGSTPSLMKAKLIMKRPGTAGYSMHQDYSYWEFLGIPADEMLNVQVSIDPAATASGPIEVFAGLHHERAEPPPGEPLDADESKIDLRRGVVVPSEAGDLLLFHSMLPHRSDANRSAQSRRALFLTYTTGAHGDVYRRYHEGRRAYG